MKIRFLLLIALSALSITVSYAQKGKKTKNSEVKITKSGELDNERIEFELDENATNHNVVALGEDGVLVYYQKEAEKKSAETTYEFIRFGKNLDETARQSYTIPKDHKILSSVENNGNVYLIMGQGEANLYGTFLKKYTILKYDPIENTFKKFDGSISGDGSYYKGLTVVNDIAYINTVKAPSPKKMRGKMILNCFTCFIPMIFGLDRITPAPEMVLHNLELNKKKDVLLAKPVKKGVTSLADYSIDDSTNNCIMMLSYMKGKLQTNWLRGMDKAGTLSKDIDLRLPPGKALSDVHVDMLNGKKVIFGEYGETKVKVSFGTVPKGTSVGVYFGVVGDNQVEKLNFFTYAKIKNFKAPMSKGEKRKTKKADKAGKETGINLGITFAKPLFYNDQIITVGEVYFATYRREIYREYVNGKWVTRTRVVFDGWEYTNILFAAFDLNGNMLWSNSTPYSRPKSMTAPSRIRPMLQDDGSVLVVYTDGKDIKQVVVSGEKIVQGTKTTSIGGSKRGDKVKAGDADDNDVLYWYENFYLATGKHYLKNKELKGGDRTRWVYFIKKVPVDY